MISNSMINLIKNSSTIRAMFEEGQKLANIYGPENVFDYSIGNPNVEPPEKIKEIIFDILNEEKPNNIHGYMNNSGYEDVRETIALHLNKKHNMNLNSKNVLMTCGAAGGLNVIFKTLLNPEDEVIVFAPFFGEYVNYVNNFAAKTIVVSANTETFQPNLDEFRERISPRTRAVIINTPNNPTGVIYSSDTLVKLSKILSEFENKYGTSIYLISDEPYREVVYDNNTVPQVFKYYKNSFIVYSYSKSLSLPGERIGYLVMNENIDSFELMVSSLNIANRVLGFINAPSLFQKVIARALDLEVDVDIYKRNRDLLYNKLTSLGIECIKPQGAFYLFPKSPIVDDVRFCQEAKNFNILAVPGSVFGCPGYFRLSYCISYEKIEKSLKAFEDLIKSLN